MSCLAFLAAPAAGKAGSDGLPALVGQAQKDRDDGDAAGLAALERRLTSPRPESYDAWMALSAVLGLENKVAESADAAKKALALKPRDFEAEEAIGESARQLGRDEEAVRYLESALKERPDDYWTCVELARSYFQAGRLDRAKQMYALARRINPKQAQAYVLEGYADMGVGRDAQAKKDFEDLIAADTASPIGYHHMGEYLSRHGRDDQAEAYFRKAYAILEADPRAPLFDVLHAARVLGDLLERQKRFEEAQALYRSGLAKATRGGDKSWRAEMTNRLAHLYDSAGRDAEAERYYQQAADICRAPLSCREHTATEIFATLGLFYSSRGRKDEARSALESLRRLRGELPDNGTDLIWMGSLDEAVGDDAKAEDAFQRALQACRFDACGDHADQLRRDLARLRGKAKR